MLITQVKYQQKYEQEIKGKASSDAGAAEVALAKESAEKFSQVTLRSVLPSYGLCSFSDISSISTDTPSHPPDKHAHQDFFVCTT